MRLFKYKAGIHVPDCENQCDYSEKGLVQVEEDNYTKGQVGVEIWKRVYKSDKNVTVTVNQILIII